MLSPSAMKRPVPNNTITPLTPDGGLASSIRAWIGCAVLRVEPGSPVVAELRVWKNGAPLAKPVTAGYAMPHEAGLVLDRSNFQPLPDMSGAYPKSETTSPV